MNTIALLARLAAILGGLAAAPAVAQNIPGPVDEAIIGDWQCGGTRVYITFLGSIELVGDDYTAGLIRAEDGTMQIEWDRDATRSDWDYDVSEGDLTLMPPADPDLNCVPRS